MRALSTILMLTGCLPIFLLARRVGRKTLASATPGPSVGAALIACGFLWLWSTAVMLSNEHRFYFSVAVASVLFFFKGIIALLFPPKSEPLVEMLQPSRQPKTQQPHMMITAAIWGATVLGFAHGACLKWMPEWSHAFVHFYTWLHFPGVKAA